MKLKLSPDVLALNPGVGKAIAIADDKREAQKARVPRAAGGEGDGLTTLLVAGWSTRTRDGGKEWQLYQSWGARLETGWHADQSDACAEAKRLQKGLEQ